MRLYKAFTAVLFVAGSLPASSAFSVVSTQIQTQSLKLPTHSFSPSLKVNARTFSSTRIHSSLDEDEPISITTDPVFNGKTTVALVAGQSLLIGFAVIAAQLLVSTKRVQYRISEIILEPKNNDRLPFCHGDLTVSQF